MVALRAIEEWYAYLWGSPVGGGVYIGSSMTHIESLTTFPATLFVKCGMERRVVTGVE